MPSALSFAQHMPDLLMVAGVILLTGLMLMNLRRRGSRRNTESPRDFIDRVRDDNGVRTFRASEEAAGRTLRDYDEFVRDLSQRLDVKTTQLERLLEQAEARIKMLEAALNDAPGASISPSKAAAAAVATPSVSTSLGADGMLELDEDGPLEMPATLQYADAAAAQRQQQQQQQQHHQPLQPLQPLQHTQPVARYVEEEPEYALTPEIVVPAAPLSLDPLSASVYELADRGRSPVEIAQQLDEQVGKVELILALRQAS